MKFSMIFEAQMAFPTREHERQVILDCVDQSVLAEEMGYDRVWAVEHHSLLRYAHMSAPEIFLTFVAARTSRIRIGHGVVCLPFNYNHPIRVAERAAMLDVLSGGRAWLGIGAAWNQAESRGLGIPFPPIAERFERLEETLRICLQMWEGKRGSEKPFTGKHYQLERPLNVPQTVSRPRPRILIGGMGEKKTLRLVAQYADACNLFPTPELPHKLDVLREHCKAVGRNYDEIEKTAVFGFDIGENGEKVGQVIGGLRWLAGMGIQTVVGNVPKVYDVKRLEIIGEKVIPAVVDLEPAGAAR